MLQGLYTPSFTSSDPQPLTSSTSASNATYNSTNIITILFPTAITVLVPMLVFVVPTK